MNRSQHVPSRMRLTATAGTLALLAAAALTVTGTPAGATTATTTTADCAHSAASGRTGHISGVTKAAPADPACRTSTFSDAANGTPPLLFHGGSVMGTPRTGPVVITPIFWTPAGHVMPSAYKDIVSGYLRGVAADSGKKTNVFSTLNEYYGANGDIRYAVGFGTAVDDTSPLPADGCTLSQRDTANIYADRSGYDACLDDAQIVAETDRVIASQHLPRDYGHMYLLFLPKHVESCFNPGSTTTSRNFCTINHWPSTAFCAYHGQATSGTVYSNMPFPIYYSATRYTCSSDLNFGQVQAPNGNLDADTEVSPTSHEVMESITDPDASTGWYDSSGYENGDECAYVFGATAGAAGQMYNQVVDGRSYLTQEEFSNRDFARTGKGCLPHT